MVNAIAATMMALGALILGVCSVNGVDGGVAAASFGLAAILKAPSIYKSIRRRDIGPRWVTVSIGIILASSGVHAAIRHNIDSSICFGICMAIPLLYLTARSIGPDVVKIFPIMAVVESVAILATRIGAPYRSAGVFFNIHHFSVFVILLGIVLAPSRYRIPVAVIGVPAVFISGSEEGLFIMALLAMVVVIREKRTWLWLAAGGLVILVAVAMVTGYYDETHPDISAGRLASLEEMTHGRAGGYTDVLTDAGTIYGHGWAWEISRDTIHNVPLLVASQLGILAGVAWVVLLAGGLVGTRHKYLFVVLLGSAMIDHYLWTHLFPWFWILLGAAVAVQPENVGVTVRTNPKTAENSADTSFRLKYGCHARRIKRTEN